MAHDVVSRRDDVQRGTVGSADPLRVLHVVIQAGPTNSQWNEHCLPVADERRLIVCSLFPATVAPDPRIERLEGDGTVRGAMKVLRTALRSDGYDVVHVHAPASATLLIAACALERRGRADIVFTLHNSWQNLRPRNRWLAALAFAAFPQVVACSRAAAASIPARVQRLVGNGVQVVPNGVDVDRIDRALKSAAEAGDGSQTTRRGTTFVTVGRLIPIKDHATLLRAFASAAGAIDRLVIVGEGPLRKELERLARDLEIEDRLELRGLMPRDAVYQLLGRADVFVSPSHGEGLPLSVLEAMTAKLPIVLSDIPPHREIVESTTGAALVPVGDVACLAEAMRRLRDTAPPVRAAIGARCRRTVVGGFSLRSMSDGYHHIYSGVTASAVRFGKQRPPRPDTRVGRDGAVRPDKGGPVRQNMDLGDVAGGIRRRWWLLCVLGVLGAVAGYLTATNVPIVYRAEATVLVGPTDGAVTHSSTIRASEDLAAFYADMARRQLVLAPVAARLHLDGSWADLRDRVSAVVPKQNLRLVTVTVLGDEQGDSEEVADAIVDELVALSPAAPDGNEQAFVNQQVDDLKQAIEQAQQRIDGLQARIAQSTDESVKADLQAQVEQDEQLVGDWQSTYVDLVGVEPSSDAGGLQVLDEATPVTDKDRSGLVKQAAVGGFAGVVLGMLLAWLLHRRQIRRFERWDAEREATAPDRLLEPEPTGRSGTAGERLHPGAPARNGASNQTTNGATNGVATRLHTSTRPVADMKKGARR